MRGARRSRFAVEDDSRGGLVDVLGAEGFFAARSTRPNVMNFTNFWKPVGRGPVFRAMISFSCSRRPLLASKLDLVAGRLQGHRDGFGCLLRRGNRYGNRHGNHCGIDYGGGRNDLWIPDFRRKMNFA